MSRYHSYLRSAQTILSAYRGEEPFASFAKKYFARHKQAGSRDRKQISHLCYCYFRTGKAFADLSTEERIITSLLLCSTAPEPILEALRPEWAKQTALPLKEKLKFLQREQELNNLFPWTDQLSEGMDASAFAASFFVQPSLFLRIRPGKERQVAAQLHAAGIPVETTGDHCIALVPGTKADEILAINRDVVVQDRNSQRIGNFIEMVLQQRTEKGGATHPMAVWDCCAASGGKSILAWDIIDDIELTVSDIRESVLINLKKRFNEAGIKNFRSLVLDLAGENAGDRVQLSFGKKTFDLVMADVPCSGSGTWSRTPEQLFYYDTAKTGEYAALQQKIAGRAASLVKEGGFFLYSTCSVFRQENEAMVDFLKQQFHLRLVKMELLKGYEDKADSMFAALFQR